MSDIVVSASGLGKRYRIRHQLGPQDGLRHVLQRLAMTPIRRLRESRRGRASDRPDSSSRVTTEDFWALRDVSFDVARGAVLGILGRNGAGKSTLLKVLSRITEPTEGSVRVRGRVASLLEVGTGFHPELTGRENIFVNGAILGMTRQDVLARFDEIVAFAEVERFLDTPVKRYSSGMHVRLAFAIAAHLEPEILIVDEVLAVGDVEFQKKCLGRMKRVSTTEGRTVLFVSHNLAVIQALCTEALYLKGGRVVGRGSVEAEMLRYSQEALQGQAGQHGGRRLSDSLVCERLTIDPNPVHSGAPASFSVELSSTRPTMLKELAILFYSSIGTRVAILDLRSTRFDYAFGPERSLTLSGTIKALNFIEGDYSVGLYVNCGDVIGDILDVSVLSVTRSASVADIAPYAARDCGYVRLEYDFAPAGVSGKTHSAVAS